MLRAIAASIPIAKHLAARPKTVRLAGKISGWAGFKSAEHSVLDGNGARPKSNPLAGADLSPPDFLDILYRGILGRRADPEGMHHYLGLVERGTSWEEIVTSIRESEEATLAMLRTLRRRDWLRQQKYEPVEPMVFLHIMKTGGTALTNGLRRVLGEERCITGLFLDQLVALPPYVFDHRALIAGHLPWETLELLPSDVATCTLVRDPLERVLSHYWHLRQEVSKTDRDLSLEEFLDSPLSSNYQARQLVHRIGIKQAWNEFSPEERLVQLRFSADHLLPLQSLFESMELDRDEGQLQREVLDRIEEIDFVETTDRIDSLFSRVVRRWGVDDPPPLARANVARDRMRVADVPKHLVDRIVERNTVDYALYERVRGDR